MCISTKSQYQTCSQLYPLQFLCWQNFKCCSKIGRSWRLNFGRLHLTVRVRQLGGFSEMTRHAADLPRCTVASPPVTVPSPQLPNPAQSLTLTARLPAVASHRRSLARRAVKPCHLGTHRRLHCHLLEPP